MNRFTLAAAVVISLACFATAQRDDPPPRSIAGEAVDKALEDVRTLKIRVEMLERDKCCCK